MWEAVKSDLLLANAASALFIILFVIYFCIRMVTNTKSACKFTLLFMLVVGGYLQYYFYFFSLLDIFTFTFVRVTGIVLFLSALFCLLKGLDDEEKKEEYVHKRKYWWLTFTGLYSGLFLIVSENLFFVQG